MSEPSTHPAAEPATGAAAKDDSRPPGQAASPALTDEELGAAVEALLLLATEPVPAAALAEVVEVPVDRVAKVLEDLRGFYQRTGRGFTLRHVGGGWRYHTRPEHADLIARWAVGGQQAKLSQAALETLAVIAYLQPISRTRISAVRGVSVDAVVRTLLARELIVEAGVDELTGAAVFATTSHFLERLGLTSLDELPPLAPYLPDAVDLEAELGVLADPGRSQDETNHAEQVSDEPAGDLTAEEGPVRHE